MIRFAIIIFISATYSAAVAQPISFAGQGERASWTIDGELLVQDISINVTLEMLKIESADGGSCEVREEGFSYYPVTLGYTISPNFVASNRDLLGTEISLRIVFSRRQDADITFDLPDASSTEFSVRRRQADRLDELSRTRNNGAAVNVVGFLQALFITKYYDVLLSTAPPAEADTLERRRLYFAKIAANFLFQQHVQNQATNVFVDDPIILPDGDAYDLLLRVLADGGEVSRNTVLGTRYRSFWFLRDRIEKVLDNGSGLTVDLLEAASSVSSCLLDDDGLKQADPVLISYLQANSFYVPPTRRDLFADPGSDIFNMWRVLYQERFQRQVPATYDYDTVLRELFEPN